MSVCLSRLSAEKVVLPSIGGLKNHSFGKIITREQMNGFSLNLVWRVCQWRLVHSSSLKFPTIGNTKGMNAQSCDVGR
jgi:hypothetical protein